MFLGTDAGPKVTPAGSGPLVRCMGRCGRFGYAVSRRYGRNTQTPIPLIEHKLNSIFVGGITFWISRRATSCSYAA